MALCERLRGALPHIEVELAYIEFLKPTLAECVELLWRRGYRDIAVLPAFIAAGTHLQKELPELVEQAHSGREGLSIRLFPALGDLPEVQQGVVRFVADQFVR